MATAAFSDVAYDDLTVLSVRLDVPSHEFGYKGRRTVTR
jgi:hypothetical protein